MVYSIFYFSVVSRIQQIGQFQTIGMTPGQVKKMIRREGLLLSAFSIPSALLVSGITAYSLVSDGWSFKNYLVISVLTSIAGCFIVQISISRPASVAAKISPVEASRIVNSKVKEKPYNYKHKYLSPYTLAKIECRNNRKKWWLATVSLAFGGILFMVASTWNSYCPSSWRSRIRNCVDFCCPWHFFARIGDSHYISDERTWSSLTWKCDWSQSF